MEYKIMERTFISFDNITCAKWQSKDYTSGSLAFFKIYPIEQIIYESLNNSSFKYFYVVEFDEFDMYDIYDDDSFAVKRLYGVTRLNRALLPDKILIEIVKYGNPETIIKWAINFSQFIDPSKIFRIVYNFMPNAHKFLPFNTLPEQIKNNPKMQKFKMPPIMKMPNNDDKVLAIESVTQNPAIFRLLSKELQNDNDVIDAAIKKSQSNIDSTIISIDTIELLQTDYTAINKLSAFQKRLPQVQLAAMHNYIQKADFLTDEMKKNVLEHMTEIEY